MIEQIDQLDGFKRIKIRNHKDFIYFSDLLPMQELYQTLAEQLYEWQWHFYRVPETRVTCEDIVFDCGCAEGIFSFLNRNIANHIYAFEPLPEYLDGLEKTFQNSSNVSIMKFALSDKCGDAYLKRAGIRSCITMEHTDTRVDIATIDSVCEKLNISVSYIKADLEGHEMNLLKGASRAIQEFKPKIAITTYHKENDADNILRYLKDLVPSYNFLLKGIEARKSAPVMLHAWINS